MSTEQSTARIPLKARDGSVRAYALVDAEDYERLTRWIWRMDPVGYAVRSFVKDGQYHKVPMHREIVGTPHGMHTDHVNRNILDNRRSNLRVATCSENQANRPKPPNNVSGFKGVSWDTEKRKWRATIEVKGKSMNLGRFVNIEDAARAYDRAAVEYFGQYAGLNYP